MTTFLAILREIVTTNFVPSIRFARMVLALVAAQTLAPGTSQSHAQQPLPSLSDSSAARTGAIVTTTQTPVTLQLRSEVEVSSFVVRVGDVIVPVGQQPKGWEELSTKAIALLPSGGNRLRMERQRISECLERTGLLSGPPRWTGPTLVSIAYVPAETPVSVAPSNRPIDHAAATYPAAYRTDSHVRHANLPGTTPTADGITATRSIEKPNALLPRLFPAERNRIERMILAAFPKTHAEVLQKFEISIPTDDEGIAGLKDLRAVRSLRLSEEPKEGKQSLFVSGESELDTIEATVEIEFFELPVIVFTTTTLNRGDIISARDVVKKPIPRKQLDPRQVTDIQLLLNKEMTRTISANRPVMIDDFSDPLVINRGDLVELRVVGAGVTVVTEARAQSPAAAGESVMVETQSPKQKILTRAVSPGVVEIVTRPPNLQSNRY